MKSDIMKISIEQVRIMGNGLVWPKGVVATDEGIVYAVDARGCCSHITSDGITSFFGTLGGTPNGICLDARGNCIIANTSNGEVQLLFSDGRHDVLLAEEQGEMIFSPNFPFLDLHERLWVSCSVDYPYLDPSSRSPVPVGCLILIGKGEQPRIAAEDVLLINGVAVDEEEKFVYVAETMMRRILRFSINEDNTLGAKEVYGPENLGPKGFPGGIAFDEAGNLWIAFPSANAVGFIDPNGKLEMFLEDPKGLILSTPTDICFGGKDRKTAFIGSLGCTNIPCFDVPYPGVKLIHQARKYSS
ncbi:MAG: SMP-30/gluconolactonase/LRE family protein [Smithella sp.]